MTSLKKTKSLLDIVGKIWAIDAYVVGLVFLNQGILAAARGDGQVTFFDPENEDSSSIKVHDGACLSSSVDLKCDSILTGGDDGRLATTFANGKTTAIAQMPRSWVEPITVSTEAGIRAASFGKTVQLYSQDGTKIAEFEHKNTVGGLAFDPKGKRLATAHYGGASLWWVKAADQKPKSLEWAGSHLSLTWSPDGKYIVTATQENDLHGWRISDGANMRMAGYATKVKSMSWMPKGPHLATSGATPIVCWPFYGKGGPMGKAPLDLNSGIDGDVTIVAAHPKQDDVVAAGYENGAAVLAQIDQSNSALIKHPYGGAVTALAWSKDGQDLAVGTECGQIGRLSLSDWRAPTSPYGNQ